MYEMQLERTHNTHSTDYIFHTSEQEGAARRAHTHSSPTLNQQRWLWPSIKAANGYLEIISHSTGLLQSNKHVLQGTQCFMKIVDFVLNKKSPLQVAIALFGFAAVAAIAEAGLIGHGADHYVSKNKLHGI